MQVFLKLKEHSKKKKVWLSTLVVVLLWGAGAKAHELWFPEYELSSWHEFIGVEDKTYEGTDASSRSPGSSSGASYYGGFPSTPMSSTPEPGTIILFGSGLAGLIVWKQRFFK
jgi:PEP-CTERM motif